MVFQEGLNLFYCRMRALSSQIFGNPYLVGNTPFVEAIEYMLLVQNNWKVPSPSQL